MTDTPPLTIWECTHDVEVRTPDGHITCADCDHVRIAPLIGVRTGGEA